MGCIRDSERRRKSQGKAEGVNARAVVRLAGLADLSTTT